LQMQMLYFLGLGQSRNLPLYNSFMYLEPHSWASLITDFYSGLTFRRATYNSSVYRPHSLGATCNFSQYFVNFTRLAFGQQIYIINYVPLVGH
jgi:hypothetical protein